MLHYVLKIEGMRCGMCEEHMNTLVRNNFKVSKLKSSHSKGQTSFYVDSEIDESKLKSLIDSTGYTLGGIEIKEEEPKKGFFARIFKK